MNKNRHRNFLISIGLSVLWLLLSALLLRAATFTNNSSISVSDPDSSLTCTGNSFTVSCWFRISIPSSVTLHGNMNILMDRTDGIETNNYSYLLRYNATSGDVEFLTKGTLGTYPPRVLIQRPYLERWYHVAITRSGASGTGVFNAYVDGRALLPVNDPYGVGNTTGAGLSIGGISGSSNLFFGDIIEVAVYNTKLEVGDVQKLRFSDARSLFASNLKGYYKLAYSTNSSDFLRNFAPTPPQGTDFATAIGTGVIGFEETDRAGEQSLFDSCKNQGADAIAPLSGVFVWEQTALASPTPGIGFDFQFGYCSGTPSGPPPDGALDPYGRRTLGPGWRHTFDIRLFTESTGNPNEIKLMLWDGSIETWTRTNLYGPLSTRHKEYRGELTQLLTGDLAWTNAERLVYFFRDPSSGDSMAGRLREIRDFNGNSVQLLWGEGDGLLTKVIDTAGRSIAFTYDDQYQLTTVTLGAWEVHFAHDSIGRLTSKTLTNTSGAYASVPTTWQFFYSGLEASTNLLARIVDPRTNDSIQITYDQYGRKTNEVDALNRTNATLYGMPGKRQITRTDPGGFPWVETLDRKGHVLSQQDPLGNMTSYTYDGFGNRTGITEPLGYRTFFGYDTRANVVACTNELSEVTRWVFHPFFNKAIQEIRPQPPDANGWTTWTNFYAYDEHGNLTAHYDELGPLIRYTYETNGVVLTSTDSNGNVTRFAYDTSWFLAARTDPATNTTAYALNDVGWKLAETNALGQVTAYTLDLNGNIVRTFDPLQRIFTKTYDPNGNLLSASDAKGQLTLFYYDEADQKTQAVDRVSATNLYFYTSRGALERTVDPLGNTVTNFYDKANRLMSVADPMGNFTTNLYDKNGNKIALIDKVSQRWSKTYDRLNRVIAETDPLGDTKYTSYDPAGRISQITTPKGFPSTHYYDGRGRLVKWVDAEGFQWKYDYDGVGNITNITDALNGHYIMAYGRRNERILEQNQETNRPARWSYTYDELQRLKTQTDPNGTTRALTYDRGNRLKEVRFSTGRVNAFNCDPNNNPTVLVRTDASGSVVSELSYDPMDRVVEYTALDKTIRYAYDPLGRISVLTYPDGKTLTNRYDSLSRLTNQVDWARRELNYTYDKAGRLVSRTYPNAVVQLNAFDRSGQLTNMSLVAPNPSISMAINYAYDRNGNKTATMEAGTFDWPAPTMRDEIAHYTPSGRLIDRQISTNAQSQSSIFYSYDPNGNLRSVTGNGLTWSVTYDEDNRVTSFNWDCGITSKINTNRYDALGRRISRTVDSVETRYVLDLTGSMERILCDVDAADTITAYYIQGPDLCYKVTPGPSETTTCYHADAQANIIALTDGNTNVVARYAYTPYGRSLGENNCTTNRVITLVQNPYRFVGSQGVMEELPDLYFMRARYYSAQEGAFLSTDPVKHIGPGWKPTDFSYGGGNPLVFDDPRGEILDTIIMAGIGAVFEGTFDMTTQVIQATRGQRDKVDWGEYFGAVASGAIAGASSSASSKGLQIAAGGGAEAVREIIAAGKVNLLDVAFAAGESALFASILPDIPASKSQNLLTRFITSPNAQQNLLANTGGHLVDAASQNLKAGAQRVLELVESRIDPKMRQQNSLEAIVHADALNIFQATSGSGGGGGGGQFMCTPPPPPVCTPPPPNPAPQPPSNSGGGNFWQSVGNWFSSLFGGGKKK